MELSGWRRTTPGVRQARAGRRRARARACRRRSRSALLPGVQRPLETRPLNPISRRIRISRCRLGKSGGGQQPKDLGWCGGDFPRVRGRGLSMHRAVRGTDGWANPRPSASTRLHVLLLTLLFMVATSVTGAEGLQLGGLPPGPRFDVRAAHSDSASALVDAANDGHPSGPPVAGIQPWQKLPWSPINKPRGRWTRLQYADPELRDGPSIVHDPVRKRLILFGGFDGSDYHNDTWVFDEDGGTEWRPLHVDGPLPPGRSLHVAVYDSVADAIIVYGGSSAGPHFGDIWMLDLHGHSGWHELPQADEPRPARRGGCVGTLDIAR